MNNIVYLYQQLGVMLVGSQYNKYSPQAVLDARNKVVDMVEDELRSFLNSVSSTIKTADRTERHAKKFQHSLFGQMATITEEKNRLLSLRTWWERKFGVNSVTEAQLKHLWDDEKLIEKGLQGIDKIKKDLVNLYLRLKGLEQSVVSRQSVHRMATSLELSIEDLIAGLISTLDQNGTGSGMAQLGNTISGT